MTSTQITGGSVKFTEPSNYSTGKAGCEVTIHFTVAEGDPPAMQSMMCDLARREAMRTAMGGPAVSFPTQQPSAPAASPATTAAPQQPEPAATAVPIIGVVSEATTRPSDGGGIIIGGPPTQSGVLPTQDASAPSPGIIGAASSPPSASSAPSASDGGVIIGHSHSAPNGAGGITDLDLREAVNQAFKRLDPGENADEVSRQRGPVIVGKLLAEFVTPPAKVYALSQDQRAVFVERLAALA